MAYGHVMTNDEMIPASEAFELLGYKNRSSLTRLVQAGNLVPAFTASGKRGEQFFYRRDIEARRLLTPVETSPVASTGVSFIP